MIIINILYYRFIISGILNTLIGYSAFLISLYILNLNSELCNLISYVLAIICSYMLNNFYVFKYKKNDIKTIILFIFSFMLSYIGNFIVFKILIDVIFLRPEFAQIFAMIVYTISFFTLNRYLVFFKKTT